MNVNLKELDDETWEVAERFIEHRDRARSAFNSGIEKRRLIENGTISLTSVPNIMVKRDEKWVFPPSRALSRKFF